MALCLGTGVTGAARAQAAPQPWATVERQSRSRFDNYLNDVIGPSTVLGIVGGGGLDHLRRKPVGWNGSENLMEGIASRAARTAIQASVRHGMAAVMHYSTEYQPCGCHGFGPKVGHALLESFTDRRPDGTRALSVPRITAAYAGSFARMAWEPGRDPGQAATGAALSLGFNALFNVARELTGLAH
jgi:hypothetical protein